MAPEFRLITSPGPTYAALARAPSTIGPLTALRRPLLVTVLLGCAVAMMATRHVTLSLVISTTLCWSVFVFVQIVMALAAIARPARRTVGVPRALDLFFASHVPWSLWILAVVAWAPLPGERALLPIFVVAFVPIALTCRIVAAFFREVLALDRRAARRRTAAHQAVTWTLLLIYFGWAVAAIPRIVEWFK